MSTTIDSLDIQIRSSAGSAAVNIENLADSLAKLKQNGKISTVANNLKKLGESLNGLKNTNQGIQALDRFGNAFKRVSQFTGDSSGFSKAINTLRKLPALAGELKTLDLSGFSAQMQALESGMSSLSGIANPKGLTTSLNALKKIPEITSSLNPQIIDEFGDKVEKLAAKLGPLATQIDKVGNGFAKLPSQVSKTVTATNRMEQATERATNANKKHDKSLNAKSINLMSTIQNLQEYVQAINFVADGIGNVMDDAMQWDGIQFRFGRAFGEDAEQAYSYAQKLNEQLGLNIQTFMQYSSLYGSLLSGFGMQQDQVTTISIGLTELSYDIWAAYNDRYKSLEDASEAVRSAITGEIEPIRNAGIALTEASMQEFADSYNAAAVAANDTVKAFEEMSNEVNNTNTALKETKDIANGVADMVQNGISNSTLQATADTLGLKVSVEKLTEAQKSELRYVTMVNAAMNQGIVGTYASELNTAEGVMRNLAQQVKTLGQTLGQLFIPVLMVVIPWVTAFVEVLTLATRAIANFFGVELFKINWGDSINSAAGGVQKVADGAGAATGALKDAGKEAKKLKDYTMGFDELNIISPDTNTGSGSSGGSGGAGGGGIGTGDSLGLDLDTLWDKSVFSQVENKVSELKGKILGFFNEFKTEIAIIAGSLATLSMAKLLGNLSEAIGFGSTFQGILDGIKKAAGTAIVITVQFMLQSMAFESFIDGEGLKEYIAALLIGGISAYISYKQWGPSGLVISLSVTALASFKAVWDNGGITNVESATVALTGLASAIGALSLAVPLLKKIKWAKILPTDWMKNFVSGLKMLSDGTLTISHFIQGVVGLKNLNFLSSLANGFMAFGSAVGTALAAIGGGSVAVGIGIVAAAVALVASAIYFLKQNWDEVKAAAKNFFDINIVPKLEKMKESWDKIKEALSPLAPIFKGIKDFFEPVVKSVKDFVSNIDWGGFWGVIGKIVEVIGGGVFYSLTMNIAGLVSAVATFIEGFVQYVSGWVQIISGVVEAIVKLFTGDLQGAKDAVIQIRDGIVDVFKGLYNMTVGPVIAFVDGIIDWFVSLWDELVGHSIVPDTIDSIVDWFLSLPGKVLSKLKSEFVDPVIDKFLDMKKGITEKIEEIKKMFSDKWTSIKSWFSANVAPKFTKKYWEEKFSVIKEGFSSAWTDLKKWWSELELPSFKIKTPHITWSSTPAKGWIATTLEALGLPSSIPKMNVEWYANGGFPDMGQMFIAREAGPELVGNINGRTAVANNDQIVAAVSQGVYSAVVAAMGNNNGSGEQHINVYLDGKQITASVEKRQAERGRTLMGNQLGYGY